MEKNDQNTTNWKWKSGFRFPSEDNNAAPWTEQPTAADFFERCTRYDKGVRYDVAVCVTEARKRTGNEHLPLSSILFDNVSFKLKPAEEEILDELYDAEDYKRHRSKELWSEGKDPGFETSEFFRLDDDEMPRLIQTINEAVVKYVGACADYALSFSFTFTPQGTPEWNIVYLEGKETDGGNPFFEATRVAKIEIISFRDYLEDLLGFKANSIFRSKSFFIGDFLTLTPSHHGTQITKE